MFYDIFISIKEEIYSTISTTNLVILYDFFGFSDIHNTLETKDIIYYEYKKSYPKICFKKRQDEDYIIKYYNGYVITFKNIIKNEGYIYIPKPPDVPEESFDDIMLWFMQNSEAYYKKSYEIISFNRIYIAKAFKSLKYFIEHHEDIVRNILFKDGCFDCYYYNNIESLKIVQEHFNFKRNEIFPKKEKKEEEVNVDFIY